MSKAKATEAGGGRRGVGGSLGVRGGRRRWRALGAAALGLGAALALGSAASAGERLVFVTYNDVRIEARPLAEYGGDCSEMQRVLNAIFESQYRDGLHLHSEADRPLFDYETQLAAMLYGCAPPSQMFFQRAPGG